MDMHGDSMKYVYLRDRFGFDGPFEKHFGFGGSRKTHFGFGGSFVLLVGLLCLWWVLTLKKITCRHHPVYEAADEY